MSRRGRVAAAASAAALAGLVLAPAANGAQTFGSNLTAGATAGFTGVTRTWSHATLPPGSTAAGGMNSPINGVVVRWRIKVGGTAPPLVTFRITRPGTSATRTGAGTATAVTPATSAISTFDTRLPVQAGDTVGVDFPGAGNLQAFAATATADVYSWTPPLVNGAAPLAGTLEGPNLELLVNADVEPDADGDGYGDETQDQCPSDPTSQAPCAPVNGARVVVNEVSGSVLVKVPGSASFVPIGELTSLPVGSEVDVRDGVVELRSEASDGSVQTAQFKFGVFKVTQAGTPGAFTDLKLTGALECGSGKAAFAADWARPGATVARGGGRRLWGSGSGRFRTSGSRGSGSARGTTWQVTDRCNKTTEIRSISGKVTARDFVRKRNVVLKSGQRYVAPGPKKKKK